jgi:hypothetical protein
MREVVYFFPWIQIHGYKNKIILFKGFEVQYPMNTYPVDTYPMDTYSED